MDKRNPESREVEELLEKKKDLFSLFSAFEDRIDHKISHLTDSAEIPVESIKQNITEPSGHYLEDPAEDLFEQAVLKSQQKTHEDGIIGFHTEEILGVEEALAELKQTDPVNPFKEEPVKEPAEVIEMPEDPVILTQAEPIPSPHSEILDAEPSEAAPQIPADIPLETEVSEPTLSVENQDNAGDLLKERIIRHDEEPMELPLGVDEPDLAEIDELLQEAEELMEDIPYSRYMAARAAVDKEVRAVGIGSFLGADKGRDICDLLRRARTAHRPKRNILVGVVEADVLIAVQNGRHHVRLDPARRDRIDAHTVAAVLAGGVLRQMDDGRLARAVGAFKRIADDTGHGTEVQDRAVLLRLHDGQNGMHHQEGTEQIDAEHLLCIGEGVILHAGARAGDPGGIDQNVDPAEVLYDRVDRRLDGFFIGNIDRRAEGADTAEAELVGQSLYAVYRNIQQRDLRAEVCKFLCHRRADAAACAGQHDHLILIVHCGTSLSH